MGANGVPAMTGLFLFADGFARFGAIAAAIPILDRSGVPRWSIPSLAV